MIMNSLFDRTTKDLDEFYWISREDVDKLIEVQGIFITTYLTRACVGISIDGWNLPSFNILVSSKNYMFRYIPSTS